MIFITGGSVFKIDGNLKRFFGGKSLTRVLEGMEIEADGGGVGEGKGESEGVPSEDFRGRAGTGEEGGGGIARGGKRR